MDTINERKAQGKTSQNDFKNITALTESTDYIELPVVFDKKLFTAESLPKTILHKYVSRNQLEEPSLRTIQVEKQFHSVIRFLGKTYSTPYLEKTKRWAEQSAALVLILSLGLCDDSKVIEKCLVTKQNCVDALQHCENGHTYLIKINK